MRQLWHGVTILRLITEAANWYFFGLLKEANFHSNNNVKDYTERDISKLIANTKDFLQMVVKTLIQRVDIMDIYFKLYLVMPLHVGEARTRVRMSSQQCISMLNFLGLYS